MRIVFFLVLLLATQAVWPAGSAPLSLREAQLIAGREAPQLAAQRAAAEVARRLVGPADQQSDPKLIIGIENLPVEGADRFRVTRDSMTMRKIAVMQDVVRSDKLKLRAERAEADARREESGLLLVQTNVLRDVALAWIDAHFAERQQGLLDRLEAELRLQIGAADAALAGGKSGTGEPFGARLFLAQLEERKLELARQLSRARAMLARWIGDAASRPLGAAADFERLSAQDTGLLAQVDQLPGVVQYHWMQDAAQIDVKLAEAAARPDWSWEIAYAQRGPDFGNMLSFNVRIDLPIFQARRQDPAIAARQAQLDQVRAQTEAARREQIADIQSLRADWRAASSRVERYRDHVMPLARERSAALMAAYRGGQGDLMPVLEARKGEIDIEAAQLQAEQDRARAWAQLSFLLPSIAKEQP